MKRVPNIYRPAPQSYENMTPVQAMGNVYARAYERDPGLMERLRALAEHISLSPNEIDGNAQGFSLGASANIPLIQRDNSDLFLDVSAESQVGRHGVGGPKFGNPRLRYVRRF